MSVVLECAQHVEHDQVSDVDVRRGRVETKLHAQLVAALDARTQVILYMDLDGTLAQVLEERLRQTDGQLTGPRLKYWCGSKGRAGWNTATIGLPIALTSGTAMREPSTAARICACVPAS